MVVTIHQPEHLPWLGFFDKVRQADMFVLLDHVQFSKHYYQNRNKIRTDRGWMWLTVPVLTKNRSDQAICEVEVDNEGNPRWREKCWISLAQHYRKAAHWSAHADFFEDLYKKEWVKLQDLNEAVIRYLLRAFSINVEIKKSSELNVKGTKDKLILDICLTLGADEYVSGISGRDYLDTEAFARAHVGVRFQEFHHPIYRQVYSPFVAYMSTVDLLFNYGPASLNIIKGFGGETMAHVVQ